MIKSWNEMPIGVLQKIYALENDHSEDKPYKLVAALSNMTLEQVLDLPIQETHQMIEDSQFLATPPKKVRAKKQYVINGRKYDVNLNPNEMTTAQYIDFQAYSTDCEKHLGAFLSVFLVPEGKKYNNGYNIEFVHNEITQHFNVEDALALTAFFLHSLKKLLRRVLFQTEAIITMTRWKAPTKELKEELKKAEKMVRQMNEALPSLFGLALWKQ